MLNRRFWYRFSFVISLIGICFVTISPFDFLLLERLTWQEIANRFIYTTNIKDYVRNIFLFIPLGISCAGIISSKKYSLSIVIYSFLFSIILSSTIEFIQILLPSRVSSISDIVCNGLGGLTGAILYCYRQEFIALIKGIATRNYQQINLKFLAAIIVGYYGIIILAIAILINNINFNNFNNWNEKYHLSIGSEVTGQAVWKGYITSLYICDRALNDSEIIPAFAHTHSFFSQLSNLITSLVFLDYRQSYPERTQQLPNFVWQKQSLLDNPINTNISNSAIDYLIHHRKVVFFKKNQSLISADPVTKLNQKIKRSQEFSLSLILASNKQKQVGPARIVSLANNIHMRNIMIGQEGQDLVFRLRTPTTTIMATRPDFIIPNVFQDRDLHQILITFAKQKLTFYIDSPDNKYTYHFQPSTQLKLYSPLSLERWTVNLNKYSLLKHQIIFYSLLLLPLAILITIVKKRA